MYGWIVSSLGACVVNMSMANNVAPWHRRLSEACLLGVWDVPGGPY